MKHRSKYAEKLARRVRGGEVRYVLPIDSRGLPTLNREHFSFHPDGSLKTRAFTRRRRFDELE